jgi:CRP/FNR family transcriptional regulator, anaerobic regulatory protein
MNEFVFLLKLIGLNDTEILKMLSVFSHEIKLSRNDYFIKEGTVCSTLGFVIEGMCRYFFINDNGDEVTRWVSTENEFVTSFGSFINQTPTKENIQAIKPTRILLAHKEKWNELYKQEEFIRFFWVKSIEEYLIGIEARVYSLIALNAQGRYANLIQNYPKLVRNVPDKYLASILGVKPRHLSRLRAEFK